MKFTGIVRKVDKLGRLTIPSELRKILELEVSDDRVNDSIEFFTVKNGFILKKYKTSCTFCDNTEGLIKFKNKDVCGECFDELLSK